MVERLMEYDVPGWSMKQLVAVLIQMLFLENPWFFPLIYWASQLMHCCMHYVVWENGKQKDMSQECPIFVTVRVKSLLICGQKHVELTGNQFANVAIGHF